MAFPLSFRQLKSSGRIHYAHIISVVLAMVIPLPFSLIHLEGGLIILRSPPIVCFGRDSDYSIYLFVLPLCVAMTIMSCLLVLTFWTILKVYHQGCNIFSECVNAKITSLATTVTSYLLHESGWNMHGVKFHQYNGITMTCFFSTEK